MPWASWFKKSDPIDAFWKWFLKNSDALLNMQAPDEATIDAVHNELLKIDSRLVFEVEVKRTPRAFVVSADGIRELFPLVMEVVRKAPEIPNWTILAFRQPGPVNVTIEMGETRLGPDDMLFESESDGDRIGIVLYVRGYDEASKAALSRAAFILLDNALGEFWVESSLGYLEFRSLSESEQRPSVRPFSDLPGVFVAQGKVM